MQLPYALTRAGWPAAALTAFAAVAGDRLIDTQQRKWIFRPNKRNRWSQARALRRLSDMQEVWIGFDSQLSGQPVRLHGLWLANPDPKAPLMLYLHGAQHEVTCSAERMRRLQRLGFSVLAIDYRGYNNVPVGANSQFNVEYFFAGARGPSFQKTYPGPVDANYLIHNQLTAQSIVWSPCGADVNLRTNSSIRVSTKANKQAMATVDSEDVNAAIVYQLQWQKCQ